MRQKTFRCAGLLAVALLVATVPGCPLFDEDEFSADNFSSKREDNTGGGGLPASHGTCVAMDGFGGGMAVWVQDGAIHAMRYVAGVGWEADVIVATGGAEDLSVAMYGVGGAIAIFRRSDQILALNHPPRGGWDAEPTVLDEGADGVKDPRLARSIVAGASVVHAVWRKVVTDSDGITKFAAGFANRHLPGGGWEDARRIDPDSTVSIYDLHIALGGLADFAVWSSVVQFDHDINGAWCFGGVWRAPFTVARSESPTGYADVALDFDDNGVVLWEQDGDVRYTEYDSGTLAWTASAPLGLAAREVMHPRVTLNADGAGIAAWWSVDGLYARPVGNSRPLPAERIDVDAGGPISASAARQSPMVGIDAAGNARVVWATGGAIYACRYDASLAAWEFAENLDNFVVHGADFAMDASGRGIAVWWHDGVRTRIFEPEEGEIVFSTYRDGDMEIFSMRPDGLDPLRFTENTGADTDPVWSPDRTRIAWLSDRDGQPSGYVDLYVAKLAMGTAIRLTIAGVDSGNVRDPAWSTVDDRIAYAFSVGNPSSPYGGISLVDAAGGSSLIQSGTKGGDRWPTWSPDGTLIAFVRDGAILSLDLSRTGQAPQELLGAAAEAESPAWSPEGDRIAYASVGATAPGIYLLEVVSGQTTRLTTQPDGAPTWSPDGKNIAFVRMTGVGPRIFRLTASGSDPIEIPYQLAGSADPDWK